MPVKVVLFDLDETLIAEGESVARTFRATCELARRKYGIDPDALPPRVRRSARELWHASPVFGWCDAIGISSWEGLSSTFAGPDERLKFLRDWAPDYRRQAWSRGLADFGVEDAALVEELAAAFPQERKKNHVVFPEAEPIVRRLSTDYKLGLVTNGLADIQFEKLAAANLTAFFGAIVVSGDLGIGKPNPRIFRAALEKLSTRPADAVMIGDSLDRDIRGGQQTGLKTVWMNPAQNDPKDITPDAAIKNLNELPDILHQFF